MATDSLDFSGVQGKSVERLRARKVHPVPAPIVKLAQASYDADEVHEHEFETPERAAKFAELMKHAGDHTTPLSSVTVAHDPDKEAGMSNPRLVRWRAGNRRGRSL
jgi:hypothetical protein